MKIINNRFLDVDKCLIDMKYCKFLGINKNNKLQIDSVGINNQKNYAEIIKAFKICKGLEDIELEIERGINDD